MVLPLPDSPTRPRDSPGEIWRDMSLTGRTQAVGVGSSTVAERIWRSGGTCTSYSKELGRGIEKKVDEFGSSGVRKFGSSGVQDFESSRVQEFRSSRGEQRKTLEPTLTSPRAGHPANREIGVPGSPRPTRKSDVWGTRPECFTVVGMFMGATSWGWVGIVSWMVR